METVKIIKNGGSQAIRIPAQYRLRGKEAIIRKIPGGVELLEKPENDDVWERLDKALELFSNDFFEDGRALTNKP